MKTILITGSTDGIGLETARMLVSRGHKVLLHGRNPAKLEKVEQSLAAVPGAGATEGYVADLSHVSDVVTLAEAIAAKHDHLDVLINNAGVFKTRDTTTPQGLDVRFAVNTIAPYLLTKRLLPLMDASGRIINLSSAAQSSVNVNALAGQGRLADMDAYAQSKLALTMWSARMAGTLGGDGPIVVAVNPGSLLASKMVKEGFGVAGNDLAIGADILTRAALSDEFADASGKYFDNDAGQFALPHPDASNEEKSEQVVRTIEEVLAKAL